MPEWFPIILLSGVVYSENKRGPSTEPWGTPYMSFENLDRLEPTFTAWNLSIKYEVNHLSAVPQTPNHEARQSG